MQRGREEQRGSTLVVEAQADSEAVLRPLLHADHEQDSALGPVQPIADVPEEARGLDVAEAGGERRRRGVQAGHVPQLVQDEVAGLGPSRALHADPDHPDRVAVERLGHRRRRVGSLPFGQGLERLAVHFRRGAATPEPLVEPVEGEARDALHVGADEEVAEAALHVVRLAHRQGEDLIEHVHYGADLLGRDERIGDVAADHEVGAELPGVGRREITGDGAVDEQAAVELEGLERAGDAGARPHRLGEHAPPQRYGLARLDVGGHRHERPWQSREGAHRRGAPRRLL